MVARYRVTHTTEYRYPSEVNASYGRAHLSPRDTPTQRCLAHEMSLLPEPTKTSAHVDFFGNRSTYFSVHTTHTRLTVTARCLVEVGTPPKVPPALPWERARDVGTPEDRQYLLRSPLVAPSPELLDYAAPSFPAGRPLADALVDLLARVKADFRYAAGSTSVTTTLPEVMRRREGVCQDFAHLTVGCLRSLGLAARYVSGYLETDPPPGRPRLDGVDASHSWASVLVPGMGWADLDPTNNQFTNERYVTTAWGRDYTDVPPLKGVIFTEADSQELAVRVDVVRV